MGRGGEGTNGIKTHLGVGSKEVKSDDVQRIYLVSS